MRTPEGKVKDKVKEFLHSRKVQSLTHPIEGAVGFYWMPVPNGMGAPFLDFVICYKGQFVAAETKATLATRPTPRQCLILQMVGDARGCTAWGDTHIVSQLESIFNALDKRVITW